MNNAKLLKQTALVTVLGLMAVGAMAQPAGTPGAGTPRTDTQTPGAQNTPRYGQASERSSSTSASSSMGQVQKINRCSDLIGMNVKNQQGETLGEIKDLVIDFTNDRVGYVVMSADKGVLSAEKLHAVPLRAFQPSADGTTLTLNADKQKLASAEGLNKDNWPNPSSPSWGAQPFWQESGQQDRNTPGIQRSPTTDRPSTTP